MFTNDYVKVLPEELSSDPATIEAYRALKGLYPKSTSETRKEDMRHYEYLQTYIHNVNQRLTFLREDLEMIQNRNIHGKTEGPVQ